MPWISADGSYSYVELWNAAQSECFYYLLANHFGVNLAYWHLGGAIPV